MWVFNEGLPRSGKSYDCVKIHILPALKKKRHVWARLNGLDEEPKRQAIADYLKIPRSQVEEYLHHVQTKDVVKTFSCFPDPVSGEWRIADQFKNALVVVDEVHEFYVAQRKPLDPEVENFFALFGQNGGDGVILTQWFSRVHQAVKARVERKNSFQKLTVVGMKGRYLQTYYHATAPGKFAKVGSAQHEYDEAIFACYRGYADGADNTEVYEEGGKTVWKAMAVRGVIGLLLVVFGVWGLARFFFGGGEDLAETKPQVVQGVNGLSADAAVTPAQAAAIAGQAVPVIAPDPFKDLSAEQRYVFEDLKARGRIRLQALAQVGSTTRAWVEWLDTQGNQVEALELDQLVALGVKVEILRYGVRLAAGDHVQVATPWPKPAHVRDTQERLYDTSGGVNARAGVASAASDDRPARSQPHVSIDGSGAIERQAQAQL